MYTNILLEIAEKTPAIGAAKSALATLLSLANDTDIAAILGLSRLLAGELGLPASTPGLLNASSVTDLLLAADTAPLLRVYALGFIPREFLANLGPAAQLARDVENDESLARFHQLVLREASMQHEALKAYVLCAFATVFEGKFAAGMISPGGVLGILDEVLSGCRIVPGDNADMSLSFGRDFILAQSSPSAFFFKIHHELGHHIFDAVLAARSSGPAAPHDAPAPALFHDLAHALPGVLDAAVQRKGQPIAYGDPRAFQAAGGLTLLCTWEELPGGSYTHLSLMQSGGPIELNQGRDWAWLIISVMGLDPNQAAAVYSPRGVFHFGLPGKIPDLKLLRARIDSTDLESLTQNLPAKSQGWLDQLEKSGRFGHAEAEIRYTLGIVPRPPRFYAADPPKTGRDLDICTRFSNQPIQVDLTQQTLDGLLGVAIRCGDPTSVKRVLAAGASLHDPLPDGTRCLLQAGESLGVLGDSSGKRYFGPTAAALLDVLSELQLAGLDLNGAIDESGNTLLTDAASRDLALVRFLLKHAADVNRVNGRGETPLFFAVSFASADVVDELLAAGAAANVQDASGDTALHRAAARGEIAIASLLLSHGAGVNIVNQAGNEPLFSAASAAMVNALCAAGAAPDAAPPAGKTALMNAAVNGLLEVSQALLAHGADPDAATAQGETALHFAALAGPSQTNAAIIKALLDAGAQVDEETNEGVTPLMAAGMAAYVQTIQALLARGASVNARTATGRTPLILASNGGLESTRDFTFNSRMQDSIRALTAAGADVNAADRDGYTALHAATVGFDAGPVRTLLELGAHARVGSNSGVTPIANAAAQLHSAMVHDLIAAGADVTAADEDGNTPLLLALKSRSGDKSDVCRQLLAAGADVTRANRAGESPVSLSERDDVPVEVRQMISASKASRAGATT